MAVCHTSDVASADRPLPAGPVKGYALTRFCAPAADWQGTLTCQQWDYTVNDASIAIEVDAGKNVDNFDTLLDLLKSAFAYMDERIDPPSSLHRLDSQKLREKAALEILLLARDGTTLVGCAFARPTEDSLYVGKLAVALNYRGRGISRRLLCACEAVAVEKNLPVVALETRVELIENQRLFVQLGYKKVAENAHAGYTRPTSYLYQKDL